jgi:hypothetical protein
MNLEPLDYASPSGKRSLTPARRPAPPPKAWLIVMTAGLALWTFYNARLPFREGPGCMLWPFWAFVLGRWLWHLTNTAKFRPEGWSRRRAWTSWLAVPVITFAAAGACVLGLPLRVAFAISRPALAKIANQAAAGSGNARWAGKRAGLYHVRSVRVEADGGVRLETNHVGFIFSVGGFVYYPGTVPAAVAAEQRVEMTQFKHVDGNWFQYHWQD